MRLAGTILLLCCCIPHYGYTIQSNAAQTHQKKQESGTVLLLTRLDLESEGLTGVRANISHPEEAASALLDYYRNRTTVKHPVDRTAKTNVSAIVQRTGISDMQTMP